MFAMITSKEFWNKRSAIYDAQVGPVYEQAYEKTVTNTLRYLKPEHQVLDFACGTGIITMQVAPHVAHVRAIDISDEMVSRTREKLDAQGCANVQLSQTDLFDPCLIAGSYDAVLAFNVLLYVENRVHVLARIHSLLKPGGIFLSATDCLGQSITRVGMKKLWKSKTGTMPYVSFDRVKGLERTIATAGFSILDRKIVFPTPPNLFIAAQKI